MEDVLECVVTDCKVGRKVRDKSQETGDMGIQGGSWKWNILCIGNMVTITLHPGSGGTPRQTHSWGRHCRL